MAGTQTFSAVVTNKDIDDNDASAFAGTIESTAKCGTHKIIHTPATASGNILTGTMRIAEADLTTAAMTGSSHLIAGYDYLKIVGGSNNSVQQFVHESKMTMTNTGTTTNVSFYKPAIDAIDGTITNLKMIDLEMDITGISGAVTTPYAIYSPDTDKHALIKGGVVTRAETLVDNYTLTPNDSGCHFLMFAGTTKTITAPTTLPEGFTCTIMQGDANQVTVAASGGNTIFNKESHTKTEKTYAIVTVTQYTSTVTSLSGETGA